MGQLAPLKILMLIRNGQTWSLPTTDFVFLLKFWKNIDEIGIDQTIFLDWILWGLNVIHSTLNLYQPSLLAAVQIGSCVLFSGWLIGSLYCPSLPVTVGPVVSLVTPYRVLETFFLKKNWGSRTATISCRRSLSLVAAEPMRVVGIGRENQTDRNITSFTEFRWVWVILCHFLVNPCHLRYLIYCAIPQMLSHRYSAHMVPCHLRTWELVSHRHRLATNGHELLRWIFVKEIFSLVPWRPVDIFLTTWCSMNNSWDRSVWKWVYPHKCHIYILMVNNGGSSWFFWGKLFSDKPN